MAKEHTKRCLVPSSVRKYKIKPQRNTTTHSPEQFKKKKIPATPNAGEDVEKLNQPGTARGDVKWYKLWRAAGSFSKTK